MWEPLLTPLPQFHKKLALLFPASSWNVTPANNLYYSVSENVNEFKANSKFLQRKGLNSLKKSWTKVTLTVEKNYEKILNVETSEQ